MKVSSVQSFLRRVHQQRMRVLLVDAFGLFVLTASVSSMGIFLISHRPVWLVWSAVAGLDAGLVWLAANARDRSDTADRLDDQLNTDNLLGTAHRLTPVPYDDFSIVVEAAALHQINAVDFQSLKFKRLSRLFWVITILVATASVCLRMLAGSAVRSPQASVLQWADPKSSVATAQPAAGSHTRESFQSPGHRDPVDESGSSIPMDNQQPGSQKADENVAGLHTGNNGSNGAGLASMPDQFKQVDLSNRPVASGPTKPGQAGPAGGGSDNPASARSADVAAGQATAQALTATASGDPDASAVKAAAVQALRSATVPPARRKLVGEYFDVDPAKSD